VADDGLRQAEPRAKRQAVAIQDLDRLVLQDSAYSGPGHRRCLGKLLFCSNLRSGKTVRLGRFCGRESR
jgi:hypothetical protein